MRRVLLIGVGVGIGIVGCNDPAEPNEAAASGARTASSGAPSRSSAAVASRATASASAAHTPATFPEQWVAVDADFTAQFPYAPQRSVQQVPYAGGTVKQTTYSSKVGLSVFQVITSDYDFPTLPSPSTVRALLEDQALESLAQLVHLQDGTEISKGWIRVADRDAYAFKVRVRRLDNGMHYWRMLLVERRLYQLIVHVPVDGGDTVHKDRFFNGFSP